MFVGEIGIPRNEYLYDLQYWEMVLISRGYANRHRDDWSMTRWQTFNIMCAQVGSEGMKRSGLHRPTDLIKLPWDNAAVEYEDKVTQEDINALRRMMEEENAKYTQQTLKK